MFEQYRVTIQFRGGERESGFKPEIDPVGSTLAFAPRPTAPRSARVAFADFLQASFTAPRPSPQIERLPAGHAARVRLTDGAMVIGTTRAIPLGGGVWLEIASTGHELVFFPDAAVEAIDILEGRPRAHQQMIAPPVAATTPTGGSAWGAAPRAPAEGSKLNRDPFEAATVGEFDAFDPSKLKR